ncbi:MAG: LPS export ABC transporter periplasmic protein LptC [Rhodothermales bacterium]
MADVRSEISPTQESWDVRYFVTETGIDSESSLPRVEIRAAHMATFETPDSVYTVMRGDSLTPRIIAYFFDEVGDTSAVLNAGRIILHEKERTFEATGNVDVVTPEDKRLEGEHLLWYEETRTLETPGFVRIITPTEQVQGYDLVADEDLDKYTLKRMTGQVIVEEDDDVEPEE